MDDHEKKMEEIKEAINDVINVVRHPEQCKNTKDTKTMNF